MLILNIFVIFSSIFAMITYEYKASFFEPNLSVLIKSFSMYARAFGHVPASHDGQIPWHKIGISSTFFQQKVQYQPDKMATNNTLIPVDFKFFAKSLGSGKIDTSETNVNRKDLISRTNMDHNSKPLHSVNSNVSGIEVDRIHLAFTDGTKYALQEYEHLKKHTIYYVLKPFVLKIADQEFTIDNVVLANYANYPLEVAWLDNEIFGAVVYNIDSQAFYYNLSQYY